MDLNLKQYEKLGPFEIKDFVAKLATKSAQENSLSYLNAGRGNPNWVATEPRDAFFLFGQFAVTESKRVLDLPPGVGGMPKAKGIAGRLETWLQKHDDTPGASFLQAMVPWAVKKFSFDPDKFVHELADSIIGDHYPVPDRMLVNNEHAIHDYLLGAMCGNPRPKGTYKIYAVEGGTAAMCYTFKSLKSNRILNPGDTIALGVPIFTPYLEMAHLEDYDLHFVEVHAKQEQKFQYPDDEIKKLLDPKIKAFFIVNPGNPFAVALSPETIKQIAAVLKKRPDLILLTDDVYGTFVPGFRSLMGEFPRNTLGVYSYSKYFDYYYGLIDFEFFARKYLGEDIVKWMKKNVHPLDIVFRLAQDHGIVLLNGGGFAAPDWSVRISFANLENHVYDDIGRATRAIARGYRQAYEADKGKNGKAAGKKAPKARKR